MNLIESTCRLTIRFKKGIGVIRVAEDIYSGSVAGDKLVLIIVELFSEFCVECKEQICKSHFIQFFRCL